MELSEKTYVEFFIPNSFPQLIYERYNIDLHIILSFIEFRWVWRKLESVADEMAKLAAIYSLLYIEENKTFG